MTDTTSPAEPGTTAEPPAGHQRLGIALALISAAQLMVVLDATIVNIALPPLSQDLSIDPGNLTWVVNAYTLAFGGLLLLGGRIGDILGRRRVFMSGLVVFAVASFLGGIAQNETMLLLARALQGIGAAAAAPTALALITTTFAAGPARNRAMGVYAAMSGAGAAIGLILGGALTEWDWRVTFFINTPIGLAVAFLAPRYLPESERQHGRFDLPGAVTGTLGLVGVVYGLTHKGEDGATWGEVQTWAPILAGVLLLAAFIQIERTSAHALLPVRILADRTRAVSFTAMLITAAAMFSMFFFLGLYLQQNLGYSALKSGFAFLPFSVGVVLGAQVASALMSRIDPRWISGPGALLAASGLLWFHFLDSTPDLAAAAAGGSAFDSSYVLHLLPGIVVMAFGMGCVFVPLTLTAVSGVGSNDSGVGSAVLNTMQQVGGALGLAVLGTISASIASDQFDTLLPQVGGDGVVAQLLANPSGYVDAFVVSAAMIAVAGVLILVGLNVKHETIANADGDTEPVHLA